MASNNFLGGLGNVMGSAKGLGDLQSTLGFVANMVQQSVNEQAARKELRQSQDTALQQLQARQKQEEALVADQNALDREKIKLDAAGTEERRRQALRRAVAKQRAQFGAQGISTGGSSEAVLLGLFNESDAERAEREKIDNLRLTVLNQKEAAVKQKNLLESTQLAEKQRLQNLTSIF